MRGRTNPNAEQEGDQPSDLLLDRFSCLLWHAFICPYHVRVKDAERDSMCLCARHGDQRLRIGKESITGREGFPHAIYVGRRLPECKEAPPVFQIVDVASSQSLRATRKRSRQKFIQRVQGGGSGPIRRGEADVEEP